MTYSSEEFIACLFILLADNSRYKGHKINLANEFTMGHSNFPKTSVAANRLLVDYIMTGMSTYVKQEPNNTGVKFNKIDHNNDWKKNVSCHRCSLKGNQLKECNTTLPDHKNKINAMKKAGTFEAKKTGVVNSVIKGTPGDDASAASSVNISRPEHNQYQHFLGVCVEDPVELFNIGEEESFYEEDAGFAFNFCNVGDIGLVDVEYKQTSSIWMSISDVSKVGGVTLAENHWKKQGKKSGPTKNIITPDGQHDMKGTDLINRKGDKHTLCWWKLYLDSCALYHTFFSEKFLTDVKANECS